ncbi:response regulator transcription factor [Brumicola nitratireducens]|uniref:Two component LuxR family transcriptional regulator n=1 Tax=Glaciecola nitratireducens (strain JCM 12485 / KCTC 12276 / FR1064) TaxID=1085623 RepID=G4QEA2_GLANF|nr:response regulator [Glaciecola nitratireducens]AEP31376.1 two component LuxR family transcriptional regulator [Glaciecola nitratireducens FR1064]
MDKRESEKLLSEAIVHVVDDDKAVLDSISLLLTSIGIYHHTYSSAQAFLDAYAKAEFDHYKGCILMDVRMPLMSGIECQDKLKEINCELPVIFITAYGDVPTAVETMKNGAVDFIEKPYREQVLIDAIQKALLTSINRQLKAKKISDTKRKLATLSARETQVLQKILNGKANKVIALELGLSQRTIELHRAHVMEKMDVKSLAELIKITLDAIELIDS